MDRVVGGKYKLGRKLGSGSFGEIFIGILRIFFFCGNLNLKVFFLVTCFVFINQVRMCKLETKLP